MNQHIEAEFIALPQLPSSLQRLADSRRLRRKLPLLAIILLIGFGAAELSGDHARTSYHLAGTDEAFASTLRRALDLGDLGTTLSYGDTDEHGMVTVVGSTATVFGPCLEFRHDWSDRGGSATARGLACRSDDGSWSILTLPSNPNP